MQIRGQRDVDAAEQASGTQERGRLAGGQSGRGEGEAGEVGQPEGEVGQPEGEAGETSS